MYYILSMLFTLDWHLALVGTSLLGWVDVLLNATGF